MESGLRHARAMNNLLFRMAEFLSRPPGLSVDRQNLGALHSTRHEPWPWKSSTRHRGGLRGDARRHLRGRRTRSGCLSGHRPDRAQAPSAVVRAVKCMETRTGWSADIRKAYGHRARRDYRAVIVFNLNSATSMAAARRLHDQMCRHGREALRRHRQTLART